MKKAQQHGHAPNENNFCIWQSVYHALFLELKMAIHKSDTII